MKKLLLVFLLTIIFIFPTKTFAYFDTWNWQNGGYDLELLSYIDFNYLTSQPIFGKQIKKIGSLGGWKMEFNSSNLPLFSTNTYTSELREDKMPFVNYISRGYAMPTIIGSIKPEGFPTSFPSLPTSQGSWVYKEYTYNFGTNKQFSILLSRISPAILITTNANSVKIFEGKKYGMQQPSTNWENFPSSELNMTYNNFAFKTPGGMRVASYDAEGNVDISGMSENWLLAWMGSSSPLYGTNSVIFPERGNSAYGNIYNPSTWFYKVDMPVLIVFEKKPISVNSSLVNGIDIGFGTETGKIAILPFSGSQFPEIATTQSWVSSLPADISNKINSWYQRLGQFPIDVTETYSVNSQTGDITITDNFTYRSLGFGTLFAPIPPAVSLSKENGLPITINGTIEDTQLPLTIGPYMGINDSQTVSITTNGLGKYITSTRQINGNSQVSNDISSKINSEVTKIINKGHLAPWWPKFNKLFTNYHPEQPVWSQTWETPYFLTKLIPFIDEPLKTQLKEYITSEVSAYPPESYNNALVPYTTGVRRESYKVIPNSFQPNTSINPYNVKNVRNPLTLYSLSEYYKVTNDTSDLTSKWNKIRDIVKPYVNKSDWATYTMVPYDYTSGSNDQTLRGGITGANQMVAGSIGLYRMGEQMNDQEAKDFGLYIGTKSLISRLAQDKLIKYLYNQNLQKVPASSDWLAIGSKNPGETGRAILWRNSWSGYQQDVRKPERYDQFGIILGYSALSGFSVNELIAYKDMVPVLGRFLKDFALSEASEWFNAIEENKPAWYIAFTQSYLGSENPTSPPHNAYQIFNVKSYILDETPQNMEYLIDIPWVETGDYYYLSKLADTAYSYKGWSWSDTSNPTPTPVVGDSNGDGQVNLTDFINWKNEFINQPQNKTSDFNGDGQVNLSDFIVWKNEFTKTP